MKRRPFSLMRAVSLIEPLEDRIAPAGVAISPNGKMAAYKDQLGDTVQVTTTSGKFTSSQFTFDPGQPGQLMELAITGHSDFTGANVTFSIIPVAGGTDKVNIGYVDAAGVNLGSVTIPGDLGRIDVGGGASPIALGKLTVASLGALGNATQGGPTGSFTVSTLSNIDGTAGIVNVTGNIDGAISANDYNGRVGTGSINQLNIGGSLDGNTSTGAGEIYFTGKLGTVVIGGGIEGGSNNYSGSIYGYNGELASIGSVTVKGSVPDDPNPSPLPGVPGTSILGGAGGLSGSISAAKIGTVVVAGDVHGGAGTASGGIQGELSLGRVTIDGSLIGGNFASGSPTEASSSGLVFGGTVGSVFIGKNIYGGSGLRSGEVLSTGTIQKVTVMGDVAGGSAGETASGANGAVTTGFSGTINANALGSVVIEGSLIGGNLVNGDANQTGNEDGVIISATTIGSIYIGKNLTGGSGPTSGAILTQGGGLGTLVIGQLDKTSMGASDSSVSGGAGASSGTISVAGGLGTAVLTHDLTGGSGQGSGLIQVNGQLNSLVIGGGVTGGTADNTGLISVSGLLRSANIANNITGSSSSATLLSDTGYIQAGGIGTMTVGGELKAGEATGTGTLDTSGAIRSTAAIGSLTIGTLDGNSSNPAIISAVGQANLSAASRSDMAIQYIKIKDDASYADILAGYNSDTQNSTVLLGTGVSADAQIGTVTIGGEMTATNIIAGVGPGANGFGTAGSAALTGAGVTDEPLILSSIAKIVVGKVGTPMTSTTDTFGIAAQYIASASVNGKVTLTPGPDNDTFANSGDHQLLGGGNGDIYLYEV